MRSLFTIALFFGGAWLVYKNWESPITSFDDLISTKASQSRDVTLTNKDGVELDCSVAAKKSDFVVIKRKSDGGLFLVDSYTLSDDSRKQIQALKDFSEDVVRERLFSEARKTIRVELLYAPELAYFTCRRTGEKMKTCSGNRVDAFRAFLRQENITYRETTLQTTPANDRYVYLPDGISSVPCIKIGNAMLYGSDAGKLRELMAEAYTIDYSSNKL